MELIAGPVSRVARCSLVVASLCVAFMIVGAAPVSALPVPASSAMLESGDVAAGSAQVVSTKAWLGAMNRKLRKAVGGHSAQSRLVFSGFPGRVIVSRAAVFSNARTASKFAHALDSTATNAVDAGALGVKAAQAATALRVSWGEGAVVGQLVYLGAAGKAREALLSKLVARLKARTQGIAAGTAWEQVLAGMVTAGGQINVRDVLQAFTATIGPLPGVRHISGQSGQIGDATIVVDLATASLTRLSRIQREAVQSDEKRALGAGGGTVARARAHKALATGGFECIGCSPAQRLEFERQLGTITGYFDAQTGIKLDLPVTIRTNTVISGAETNGLDSKRRIETSDRAERCQITGKAARLDYTTLAHELYHCFQVQRLGSDAARAHANITLPWVMEGSANLAGCMAAGGSNPAVSGEQRTFKAWIDTPLMPLFARTEPLTYRYSAMGFFALAQQDGVNELQAALTAAAAPNPEAAYHAAVSDHEEHILESWASSYERAGYRGPDWTLETTPCYPKGAAGLPETLEVSPVPQTLKVAKYTIHDYSVENATTELMHVQSSGHVRVYGNNGSPIDDHPVHDTYYCIANGGCHCPPGQEYTGPPTKELPPTPTPTLAITAGPSDTEATVTGTEYQPYCKPAPPPPSPQEPTPPGGGGSSEKASFNGTFNGTISESFHEEEVEKDGLAYWREEYSLTWSEGVVSDWPLPIPLSGEPALTYNRTLVAQGKWRVSHKPSGSAPEETSECTYTQAAAPFNEHLPHSFQHYIEGYIYVAPLSNPPTEVVAVGEVPGYPGLLDGTGNGCGSKLLCEGDKRGCLGADFGGIGCVWFYAGSEEELAKSANLWITFGRDLNGVPYPYTKHYETTSTTGGGNTCRSGPSVAGQVSVNATFTLGGG